MTVTLRASLAIALLSFSAPVLAQSATLTVKDGRALVVGGETALGAGLAPVTLSGDAIVAEFARLCLPDPGGVAARVAASPLQLAPADAVFPAENKLTEARILRWASGQAELTTWSGSEIGLKGRAIAMPSRAAVTTGPYGPFKAFGTQCNLVIGVGDFVAAKAVLDALTKQFGPAGKLVVKNTFADGYWPAGSTRINVNVPTVRGGTQPVHLSTQIISTE